MARTKKTIEYVCTNCNEVFSRWEGRCPVCKEWNSFAEKSISQLPDKIHTARPDQAMAVLQAASHKNLAQVQRLATGVADFDLVLGGGLTLGSFVLLAGEPGVGKSTLMLELCRQPKTRVFYFSGEESDDQVCLRAQRIGIELSNLYVSRETDPVIIAERMRMEKPGLVIVDSIQTLYQNGNGQLPGMTGQLRVCTMILLEACKTTQIPVLVSGHITKDGSIAGPRVLEHMVDTVLYFERDRLNHYRLLRAIKNRFGPVGEVAVFEMGSLGLAAIDVSTQQFQGMHVGSNSGSSFSVICEGSRSIVVEVQALVSRSPYGPARRMAEGLDSKRIVLLGAVLEKYMKYRLAECDIFANLAGGLDSGEPALDLAICSAIMSSYLEIAIRPQCACIGEVGLSGEVRPVAQMEARIAELQRSGFEFIICSNLDKQKPGLARNTALKGISHIGELSALLFENAKKENH